MSGEVPEEWTSPAVDDGIGDEHKGTGLVGGFVLLPEVEQQPLCETGSTAPHIEMEFSAIDIVLQPSLSQCLYLPFFLAMEVSSAGILVLGQRLEQTVSLHTSHSRRLVSVRWIRLCSCSV